LPGAAGAAAPCAPPAPLLTTLGAWPPPRGSDRLWCDAPTAPPMASMSSDWETPPSGLRFSVVRSGGAAGAPPRAGSGCSDWWGCSGSGSESALMLRDARVLRMRVTSCAPAVASSGGSLPGSVAVAVSFGSPGLTPR